MAALVAPPVYVTVPPFDLVAEASEFGQYVDKNETLTLRQLDGSTLTVVNCLRQPRAKVQDDDGGYKLPTGHMRFFLWLTWCPVEPSLQGTVTDAAGVTWRIESVDLENARGMYDLYCIKRTATVG